MAKHSVPPRIGDRYTSEEEKRGAFILVIEDHLPSIHPPDYFKTTGEAIQKIDRLIEDGREFVKKARALKKKLATAKSDANFLETGWDEEGHLVLKQKNLRKPRIIKKQMARRRRRGI